MREKYESLSLAVLKDLAKARGMKGISTLRKPALIERMLEEDVKESDRGNPEEVHKSTPAENTVKEKAMIRKKQNIVPVRQGKDFRSSGRNIVVIRMSRNTEAQISAESTTVNITGKLQGRTGMSRQNPPSWTVVKRLTGSWRSFRMDMALSDVRIICRVRTTFMFLLPRSAALI